MAVGPIYSVFIRSFYLRGLELGKPELQKQTVAITVVLAMLYP